MTSQLLQDCSVCMFQVLHVLCGVAEYDELPVRHNEDKINTTMSGDVRWPIDTRSADDPHSKANLLLQASPFSAVDQLL